MNTEVTLAMRVAYIIIQLATVHYSFIIYRYNRLHNQWLAVTVALVLMVCQGFIALFAQLGWMPGLTYLVQVLNEVTLPLIISLFLLGGLWSMMKNFEKFDVIDRKMMVKMKKFNESKGAGD
jgi:hypothetical protein